MTREEILKKKREVQQRIADSIASNIKAFEEETGEKVCSISAYLNVAYFGIGDIADRRLSVCIHIKNPYE